MAASSEIQKLERRHAENPDGRYFAPLADAYRKAGQVDEALILVRAGIDKHPDYLSAHIVLGRCLLDKKEDVEAGQAFERVLGLDSENIIALKSLSEIAERRGELAQARQWLQKLLQVDPMNADADADLQRLGGTIAEAPTASMEALPADVGAEQPSPFSFADVAPEAPEAEAAPAAEALPEPAQVADLELEPQPSDVPAPVTSVVPGIISVQFQPPTEEVPPPELEVKPFDESLAWGTGERRSRSISQQDIEALQEARDHSVEHAWEALETVQGAAEGLGGAGLERPAAAGSPPAPAAARPDAVGDAPTDREPQQPSAEDADAFAIDRGEPQAWNAAGLEPEPAVFLEPAADAVLDPSLSGLPIIMPEDVTPPEEMARPSGKQQRAVAAPLPELPAVAEAVPGGPELPPLVTETMGDLYLQQGFRSEAAEVYRRVLARRPDDAALRAKLVALEGPRPALSAVALGGESVRAWLRRVASARVGAPAAAATGVVPPGPSPLEEAFAQPEHPAEPSGEPTRPARDVFTLDAIFGGQTGTSLAPEPEAPPPAPSPGASFDEFFGAPAEQASVRPDSAAPPEAAPADDVNSFNAWLRGLKR